MKARLYRATGEYRDCVDAYSLYLPYPRKDVKDGVTGIYLGCSPDKNGNLYRCTWEEWNLKDGRCDKLGRKIPIDLMPRAFRQECRRIEKLWNEALASKDFTKFDEEA